MGAGIRNDIGARNDMIAACAERHRRGRPGTTSARGTTWGAGWNDMGQARAWNNIGQACLQQNRRGWRLGNESQSGMVSV